MRTINIHQAKTQFSKLVDDAMHGDEIIVAKAGKPVAKLIAFTKTKPRQFGVLKGKIKIANDFDAPLPEDILADFEG
jgi:prevent-host-death family protein